MPRGLQKILAVSIAAALIFARPPALLSEEIIIIDNDPIIIIEDTPTLQSIDIIEPASLTFNLGETFNFDANGAYSDGSTASVDPSWSATCGVINAVTGDYNAAESGSCTIAASLDTHTDSIILTVVVPPPTLQQISIKVPPSLTFESGQAHDFDALGHYSDGSTAPINPTWNATCGAIDAVTGFYNATESGNCTISATLNSHIDSLTLSIETPPPSLVSLSIVEPSHLTFEVGQTFDFNAVGAFSDGSSHAVDPAWSATCGAIDNVSGLYNATETGSCTVSATLDGRKDSVALTVRFPPPHIQPEIATVIFHFEKHGPFHGKLKKFFNWMGLSYDDHALSRALKDFGKPCVKDKGQDNGHDDDDEDDKSDKKDKEKGKKDKNGKGDDDDQENSSLEQAVHSLDLLPLVDASWQGGISEFRLVLTCRADGPDQVVLHLKYNQPVLRQHDGAAVEIPVALTLDPSRVKLDSDRQFITARLELPEPYSPKEINRLTVRITRVDDRTLDQPIRSSPQAWGFEDSDEDGIPELMLKFRYSRLKPHLTAEGPNHFTLRGSMDTGEEFSTDYTQLVVRTKERREVHHQKTRIKVVIPQNAQSEDVLNKITLTPEEKRDAIRELKANVVKLKPAGVGCHFGPGGTVFQKDVQITLPYDPSHLDEISEDDLKIYYWNPSEKAWEPLSSTVNHADHTVTAFVTHFSFYQVLAPLESVTDDNTPVNLGFLLQDAYAYPNPADAAPPTFHFELGRADIVELRIFNVAGELEHETTWTGAPQFMNGKWAYEYLWDTGGSAPGLYVYFMRAKRAGYNNITFSGKVAVVR